LPADGWAALADGTDACLEGDATAVPETLIVPARTTSPAIDATNLRLRMWKSPVVEDGRDALLRASAI
jgi:hypothetical protein